MSVKFILNSVVPTLCIPLYIFISYKLMLMMKYVKSKTLKLKKLKSHSEHGTWREVYNKL
jgi:hypothetical protein